MTKRIEKLRKQGIGDRADFNTEAALTRVDAEEVEGKLAMLLEFLAVSEGFYSNAADDGTRRAIRELQRQATVRINYRKKRK